MKKSFLLVIAFALAAIMAGCGGSSSASSSKSSASGTNTPASDTAFNVAPAVSATNVTYRTAATGDFPPAPPSSSLEEAQEEAKSSISN